MPDWYWEPPPRPPGRLPWSWLLVLVAVLAAAVLFAELEVARLKAPSLFEKRPKHDNNSDNCRQPRGSCGRLSHFCLLIQLCGLLFTENAMIFTGARSCPRGRSIPSIEPGSLRCALP